jgi:hypothetical protein
MKWVTNETCPIIVTCTRYDALFIISTGYCLSGTLKEGVVFSEISIKSENFNFLFFIHPDW